MSIVYFTYFTQLFQQSQVTSHLVTLFPYKTLLEQILTAAKGSSSGGNSLGKGNCLFVDIHEEWSCTLQGHSSSCRLLSLHLHNLFLLIGLPLQETNEDLPNKKGTDLKRITHLQVILTTKRTISLITDTIILLTFGILSQSMKTYECDNFHEILWGLHKIFQETNLPCYITLNTWTLILNTLTEIGTPEVTHFQFYFMWNFYHYWREQRAVKSTNSKICRKCDLLAIHLSLQGLKKVLSNSQISINLNLKIG